MGLLAPVWAGSAVEAATGDAAFVRGMLDAEAALTRAQAATGLAPASAAAAVTAAAAETGRYDVRDLALRARSGGNPVIPLVADLTAAVAARDPDSAPYVHRGATSQDIWDTALMLVAGRALAPVLADLDRAARALAETAAAHRDTPMAGRTLTQHAVPTTFGLKVAGWLTLVAGARDRLAAVRAALPAQLGGAAGTLAAFHAYGERPSTGGAVDGPSADGDVGDGDTRGVGRNHGNRDVGEEADIGKDTDVGEEADVGEDGDAGDVGVRLLGAFAAETGLAEPPLPWHTLRAPIADLAGGLAFTAGALGKVAADVLVLSRTEIGEVAEGVGGGSSAMPHKSNPVRAVLIAAAARQVPALAGVLFGSLAAEDERPAGAWHAEWQPLREVLRLTGGAAEAAAELAEGLRVRPERMRENLGLTNGLVAAERLTIVLAGVIGRDRAKQAVTRASRRVSEEGVPLAEAVAAEPDVAALLPRDHTTPAQDSSAQTGDTTARATADTAPGEDDAARAGTAPVQDSTAQARADATSAQDSSARVGVGAVRAGEGAALSWEELLRVADPAGYLGSAGALVDRALATASTERTS
ncbi:lyase family protein [Sphaerisporangium dianthi]|uniref:Lyase family protein n=1 Tax=Sphaerisporangium dianthi TaxID=1436120 RepID=A0ABV9CD51_9ACTN